MASGNVRERHVISVHPETENATEAEAYLLADGRRKRRKRDASVYDAVAGRVTTTLPLDDGSESEVAPHSHHHRTSLDHHRDPTLAPEEVLFRRIGAPIRYAEKDIYQAHEALRDGGLGTLPESDMLKAIHTYSSRFYAALAARRGEAVRNVDECSMDGTALLAFGVLLEEAGRDVLGNRGDLVFTEGVEVDLDGEPGDDDVEIVDFQAAMTGRWRSRRTPRNLSRD
ncbi:hypothetical protein AAE478_006454 [Parahypoxylon ruwenzoriense]